MAMINGKIKLAGSSQDCINLKSPLRYLSNWFLRCNRSDVSRMDINENRERRKGELFRAEIREDAGKDEKPNVGGHRGESR